jgi:catalase
MATGKRRTSVQSSSTSKKTKQLDQFREDGADQFLTTNQGLRISDDQNSLTVGLRGPTLLEDFHYREKMTHFDHERIPERVVHARGAGAHGVFRVYESLSDITKAGFLTDPARETPVFVRFSTVAGSRGSTDLARDVRGFAVKFYTDEGVFDLVGNNIPVFFIQDAVKFPDVVHAVKPEPHNEIPQAQSAHNTFWDFISVFPESMHMIMWVMSDRAIPRSYRMMEGFGVHTFRLVNDAGKSVFVKFHWKPLLGVHSVAWDEAQQISGKDPDFHRRDLWMAIENGNFPEYELGLQIVPEEDELKFDFDLLDPTKIIPEELVPVRRVGRLTLNRNPDNFFAETEQVAFHPGHIVPGIDFSNDPLLQGRLFSYIDTQLLRLGGPNFHQLPINRSVAPVHNNQRDGFGQHVINKGRVSYGPNSLAFGCPYQAQWGENGFRSYTERVEGHKIRGRSPSFLDHFSQAALFFESLSDWEQQHLVDALRFELSKVEYEEIQIRMLGLLSQVSGELAGQVADGLGLKVPDEPARPMNRSVPADADASAYQPVDTPVSFRKSPALSQANQPCSAATRQVAILIATGVDGKAVKAVRKTLEAEGAKVFLVGHRVGMIQDKAGQSLRAEFSVTNSHSVLFDELYIPGGKEAVELLLRFEDTLRWVRDAYRHCKPLAASDEGQNILVRACPDLQVGDEGVVWGPSSQVASVLPALVAQHRFWERESKFKPLLMRT